MTVDLPTYIHHTHTPSDTSHMYTKKFVLVIRGRVNHFTCNLHLSTPFFLVLAVRDIWF